MLCLWKHSAKNRQLWIQMSGQTLVWLHTVTVLDGMIQAQRLGWWDFKLMRTYIYVRQVHQSSKQGQAPSKPFVEVLWICGHSHMSVPWNGLLVVNCTQIGYNSGSRCLDLAQGPLFCKHLPQQQIGSRSYWTKSSWHCRWQDIKINMSLNWIHLSRCRHIWHSWFSSCNWVGLIQIETAQTVQCGFSWTLPCLPASVQCWSCLNFMIVMPSACHWQCQDPARPNPACLAEAGFPWIDLHD